MGCPKLQSSYLKVAYQKKETGSTNSFELRLWDSRIGRWMSPDPYRQYHSPYLGMGNNPINGVDPDGGKSDCPTCPDGYDTTLVNDVNPTNFDYSGFGGTESDFSFTDFLDNLTYMLNGGMVYQFQQQEMGQPVTEPPQLIGVLGFSGGARLLSLFSSNTTRTASTITNSTNKTDELINLLRPVDELDTSVTLYRGFTGRESTSKIIFFTDDASVAATYIKNGHSVHSVKISEFALSKLEQNKQLLKLTGKHKKNGITSNEYAFIGEDLVKAIIGLIRN